MFARNAKFWVAAIMAGVHFSYVYTGVDLGVSQEAVTAMIGMIASGLVWVIPNSKG